ncbi:TetR/AcrR family transcriptional regulator [Catenuloplanes atrovinosus]|uniref:AcrR family transcriptional regulator n=1 Tax=Catenuloplanes atrovinosus TaxID=137266 RepID=A0AAE3YKP1_9ACTN|nr:TetR/AcrR family transcriptional regulator [Catenuloplanes atrovinosus]MDR7275225.1 AcrR family transcriptional regulator [Catenuloplanes atrovinosus]
MTSRMESAAATRRALLEAADALLDLGGPEAVTLREVGARAGMTRGAPYRHFADKETLLIAVGARAWQDIEERARALAADPALTPAERLRANLAAVVDIARTRPYLYELMFSRPAGDPEALVRAARGSNEVFVETVAALVGERDARRYGALLMAGVDGIANLEAGGQLDGEKWGTSADELIDTLVAMVARHGANG